MNPIYHFKYPPSLEDPNRNSPPRSRHIDLAKIVSIPDPRLRVGSSQDLSCSIDVQLMDVPLRLAVWISPGEEREFRLAINKLREAWISFRVWQEEKP